MVVTSEDTHPIRAASTIRTVEAACLADVDISRTTEKVKIPLSVAGEGGPTNVNDTIPNMTGGGLGCPGRGCQTHKIAQCESARAELAKARATVTGRVRLDRMF